MDELSKALRESPHKHFGVYPTWIVHVNEQGAETGEAFVDFPPIYGAQHAPNGRSAIVVLDEITTDVNGVSIYRRSGMIVNTSEIVNLN